VNQPLKFEDFALYQVDYKLDELNEMTFSLTKKETGVSLGDVTIDLRNPKNEYVIDDNTKVELMEYYPDFTGFNILESVENYVIFLYQRDFHDHKHRLFSP